MTWILGSSPRMTGIVSSSRASEALAVRDPGSRTTIHEVPFNGIIGFYWIPAFAGMTGNYFWYHFFCFLKAKSVRAIPERSAKRRSPTGAALSVSALSVSVSLPNAIGPGRIGLCGAFTSLFISHSSFCTLYFVFCISSSGAALRTISSSTFSLFILHSSFFIISGVTTSGDVSIACETTFLTTGVVFLTTFLTTGQRVLNSPGDEISETRT